MRWRRVGLVSAAVLAIVLSGCAGVEGPRRANTVASAVDATAFASPREIVEVEADPDIGAVTFRGTVRARSPVEVVAPYDLRVTLVEPAAGDFVVGGDRIMRVRPSLTESEEIELEIAELRIQQAHADGASAQEISDLQAAADALALRFRSRSEVFDAPSAGVLLGVRQSLEYNVREGQPLFTISDPDDLVVEARLSVGQLESVAVGASAQLQDFAGDDRSATVMAIDADQGIAIIEVDDTSDLSLGQQVSTAIEISRSSETTWIPNEAVGRQNGSAYVLIENASGLERRNVVIAQRTRTHVEVVALFEPGTRLVRP